MPTTYDLLILGAGHNSLILQAYLSRAGVSTLCLEPQPQPGGGLTTEELPSGSGCWHNTHSFYHRGLTELPWYRELELQQLGAEYLQPPRNVVLLGSDGRRLEWWTDFEQTVASVASFSTRDAETLRRWRHEFRPIVREILIPESQSPPQPPEERKRRLSQSAHGRLLLEVSRCSPWEFVQREFEHPFVQAGLLFFNGLREVDLRLPGFGHHIPALLASDRYAQLCRGGSQKLAEALGRAVVNAGGEIRTGAAVRRIVVENGRAAGVELADGEKLRARRAVVSGLNPQQTFLDLIEADQLPAAWRSQAENYQYNVLAPLFGLYVNLNEPPDYSAGPAGESLADALMVILGLDHASQFLDIVQAHEAGEIPAPVMWGSCPSLLDPSQAPAGRQTAFMWEKLPYALRGDPRHWETEQQRHGERLLARWTQYAPNLASAVVECFTRSPRDIERRLPNMRRGDLLVGSFAQGQVGYHRPFPGAGHYRGYLPGLYLCGSCCHPGGNITGLPGYNCTQVLLADLGLPVQE